MKIETLKIYSHLINKFIRRKNHPFSTSKRRDHLLAFAIMMINNSSRNSRNAC